MEYSKTLTHNQKEVAVPNLEKEPSAVHLRKEPSAAHPSNVPFPWLRKVCVHICAYERERRRGRDREVDVWLVDSVCVYVPDMRASTATAKYSGCKI